MSNNFNLSPYYDDFDEDKNFYRILFKPGQAVQARELTQLQTILQTQIDRFGSHIFKDGSIVLGGQIEVDTRFDYVKIIESVSDITSNQSSIVGSYITGSISGVKAYIYQIASRNDWGYSFDVLMVRYISSSELYSTFLAGEALNVDGTTINCTVVDTDHIGKGSVFSIDDGVVFSDGFFTKFHKQNIILDPINQYPTCIIGFDSVESIVTSAEDTTLLDPALGSYNYTAPGADRLRYVPTLVKISSIDVNSSPTFFSLASIKNGVLTEIKDRSSYSRLADEMAKRVFDESGNYVVRGLGVRTREHLDTGNNEGYLTEENGGDANLLAIGIEPGLAYIQGYEVNKLSTEYVEVGKSIDSINVNSEIVTARNGNYLTVNEVVGYVILDTASVVSLYDTAQQKVTNHINSTQAPIGAKIGEAKVKALDYIGDKKYNIYLFDIKMTGSNTFSQTKSITSSEFSSDVILSDGSAVLNDTFQSLLIYKLGSNYTKSLNNETGSDTIFSFERTFNDVTVNTDGTFSVDIIPTLETHSYGSSGTLSDIEKQSIILTVNSATTISLPGTVSANISTNTLNGVGTFFGRLNVGDRISVNTVSGNYTVTNITSDTSLTVAETFSSTFSGQSYVKKYIIGDIVNLNGKGVTAGVDRSVTVLSSKGLAFNLQETYSSTIDVSVSLSVTRSSAREISKTLRPNRFVKINVASLTSNTAPINLGVSDVFKIRQIRKDSSEFTTSSQGNVVTDSFIIDNGQRDDLYDHATIQPRTPLSSGDHLLVELDYFYPDFTQGAGYFSIDSYNVNDSIQSSTSIFTHEIPVYKSPFNGNEYDLRNCVDFRPVKVSTSNDSVTVAGASINPSQTDSFYVKDINGLRIPSPSSQVICDYSFYIARRDVIVCDKDGLISAVRGVPDQYPVTPAIPESVMAISNLYIPPYPSLSTTYARILGKVGSGVGIQKMTHARHTMRDIGVLKQRIENLEYYNALNLLEKSVQEMVVLDEFGLDRFKNGFFVDGFLDHSLGLTYSSDYNIAVDKIEGVIRPVFNMDSFLYDFVPSSSSNVQRTGNLVTLPYSEVVFLEQTRVTTTRNIEQSVFRFIGNAYLNPDIDTWIDETVVDKTVEFGNDLPNSTILNTEWGSWETYVAGYNVYKQSGPWTGLVLQDGQVKADAQLLGSYTSYAAALSQTYKTASYNLLNGGYTNGVLESFEGQYRTGLQTSVTYEKDTQEIGNFVTDVSIIPYIRPQVINVSVRGLKANTKYYIFFDNENMSSYATPYTSNNDVIVYGNEGDILRSDAYGELYCNLRLPENGKRFRVGQKEVVITDSPTNAIDATSYATSYFVASGVNVQKQNTIISTKTAILHQDVAREQRVLQTTKILGPSCMAYSFFVQAPEDESGIFVTSIDVFIESVHPTLGVWFEIREMDNAGGVTRTQVPYSEVWYKSDEIITTNDASTPHNVKFSSPVFLLNNTQYAFVIHTEGLNPDTYFWVSRLGETDIITGNPVTGRQLTGSLYTTNNNLNWSIVPDVDLKIRINRANFVTNVTGLAVLGNLPYEFFNITQPNDSYSLYGEIINGSDIITVRDVVGANTIVVGDKINTTNGVCNIVNIITGTYYTDSFDIVLDSSVTFLDANGNTKFVTAVVDTVDYGIAILDKYNSQTNIIKLGTSNGKFFANGIIKGVSSNIYSTIVSIDGWDYSTVNMKPASIGFQKTSTAFGIKGVVKNTGLLDSSYTPCPSDSSFNFSQSYTIKSRSDELSNYGGGNSLLMSGNMSSTSSFVSPVIDIKSSNSIMVKNIVNDDITEETNSTGGNLINKYISKTTTLADGQDAEDLLVNLTAYIPPSTDVKVWMKIRHGEDVAESFSSKPWYEMERVETGVVSSVTDNNDFKSISYKIPQEMMTGLSGAVQYVSVNNATFTGFKQYAVKVGLLSIDASIVPRVGDLKAIALQL